MTHRYTVKKVVSDCLPYFCSERQDEDLIIAWGLSIDKRKNTKWVAANGFGSLIGYELQTTNCNKFNAVRVNVPDPLLAVPNGGRPTGVIVNNSNGFVITNGDGDRSACSLLITCTLEGTICAYSPLIDAHNAIMVANNRAYNSSFTGLAQLDDKIFVADFHNNRIEVFNHNFERITYHKPGTSYCPNVEKKFIDGGSPSISEAGAGFAPYNIVTINDKLYVTYAKRRRVRKDNKEYYEVDCGLGYGYVNIFESDGTFVSRFATKGALNAPWGICYYPDKCSLFGDKIYIANHGDGLINVFTKNGDYLGPLDDCCNRTIRLQGLYGVATDCDKVYFTAAPCKEEAYCDKQNIAASNAWNQLNGDDYDLCDLKYAGYDRYSSIVKQKEKERALNCAQKELRSRQGCNTCEREYRDMHEPELPYTTGGIINDVIGNEIFLGDQARFGGIAGAEQLARAQAALDRERGFFGDGTLRESGVIGGNFGSNLFSGFGGIPGLQLFANINNAIGTEELDIDEEQLNTDARRVDNIIASGILQLIARRRQNAEIVTSAGARMNNIDGTGAEVITTTTTQLIADPIIYPAMRKSKKLVRHPGHGVFGFICICNKPCRPCECKRDPCVCKKSYKNSCKCKKNPCVCIPCDPCKIIPCDPCNKPCADSCDDPCNNCGYDPCECGYNPCNTCKIDPCVCNDGCNKYTYNPCNKCKYDPCLCDSCNRCNNNPCDCIDICNSCVKCRCDPCECRYYDDNSSCAPSNYKVCRPLYRKRTDSSESSASSCTSSSNSSTQSSSTKISFSNRFRRNTSDSSSNTTPSRTSSSSSSSSRSSYSPYRPPNNARTYKPQFRPSYNNYQQSNQHTHGNNGNNSNGVGGCKACGGH